jgi:hypothetical protein
MYNYPVLEILRIGLSCRHSIVQRLTIVDALATKVTLKISQKVCSKLRDFEATLACIASLRGPLTVFAADIISTVEFDQTGNYLATGDKGGRVVLFERNETVCILSLTVEQ